MIVKNFLSIGLLLFFSLLLNGCETASNVLDTYISLRRLKYGDGSYASDRVRLQTSEGPLDVKPNAYGLGVHSDQYGRPLKVVQSNGQYYVKPYP